MKRTVTISVPTLVLLGVVAVVALGVLTTTNSSAQTADVDAPWELQPQRSNHEKRADNAYLFNTRTGEVFLVKGAKKILVTKKK